MTMKRSSFVKFLSVFCLVSLSLLVIVAVAAAQDAGSSLPTAATASPDDVNNVAKELWCPLCSGVRLDACELRACDQMKDVIAEKLTAGETVQNIKNYFVQQYGPQVLGEPPMEGFNWLAWILPIVVLIGGGFFLWSRTRKMVHQPKPAAVASPAESGDHFDQELEKELKQYD
jgi:cytochrome c-type biogenesis protein CcmH